MLSRLKKFVLTGLVKFRISILKWSQKTNIFAYMFCACFSDILIISG